MSMLDSILTFAHQDCLILVTWVFIEPHIELRHSV